MSYRVTIVIVNWKTPELLAGCLDSILADPRSPEFQIIVVDNASGDNSLEVLAGYPQVHTIANSRNLGFPKACNQGIPLAKSPYVLLLNPDTVVSGNAITLLADFLDANPDCGAVGPKVLNTDGTLQLACRRAFPSPAASFYRFTYLSKLFPKSKVFAQYNLTYADEDEQLDVDVISGSAMMVSKRVIDQIGLMDEEMFMHGEDVDWCWRIKEAGWRVVYYPQAVIHHFHGASTRLRPVGNTINLHKGMEVFYRKHLSHKHSALFNAMVYAGIWFRAGVFIVLSFIQSSLRKRRVTQVLAK